jgi:hypothetical protein
MKLRRRGRQRLLVEKLGAIRKKTFPIRLDDVFLVSYPRSGSTWVRFLFANILSFEKRTPIDFFSVHRIVPDAEIREHREIARGLASPRIVKSHKAYTPDYPRVIYLLRDGRDVYVSYYDFLSKQGRFEGGFAEFVTSGDLPAGHWHDHVRSWLGPEDQGDLLLVRYEDLLKDVRRETERMVRFVGLATAPGQLDYAVEKSSFLEMRRIEEEQGRPYGDSEYRFVRRGVSGSWRDRFDESSKAAFKSYANNILLQLGYAETLDW